MSIDEYKACATRLQKHFEEAHNVKLTRAQSLEAVAIERGRRNWNVLAAEAKQSSQSDRAPEPFLLSSSNPDVTVTPARRRQAARALTSAMALRGDLAPTVLESLASWAGLTLAPGDIEETANFIYGMSNSVEMDMASLTHLMTAADSAATRSIGAYIESLWLNANDADLVPADQTIKRQMQGARTAVRVQHISHRLPFPSNTYNPVFTEMVALSLQFRKAPTRIISFLIEHGALAPMSPVDMDHAITTANAAVATAPDALIALYLTWSTSDVPSVRALSGAIAKFMGMSMLNDLRGVLAAVGSIRRPGSQVDWTAETTIDVLGLLAEKELTSAQRAIAVDVLNGLKGSAQPATLVTVAHAFATEPGLRAFGEAATAKLFRGPTEPWR